MVVNSLNFLLFFVVVFIIYYLPISRKLPKFQNTWLFLTSYFFYGFADWKMVPLLLGATIVFYCIGLWLKTEMEKGHIKNASNITTLGVVLGVGVLLYFKYLNFFADSFAQLLNAIGFNVSWSTLNIVLPIGVSFFTFKLISYVIEIHREHIQPSKNFIEFGTYIAFFPTILSGPIDRPNTFIPQLKNKRFFYYRMAVDGCWMILWGMFTKMVIADNLALVTDTIWDTYENQCASSLLMTLLLYPLQLYADFAGYSNMAIGVGCLLGLNVTPNFNYPFFARNVAEYWRRWHISLTSFITDYVFTPLNIAFRNWGNNGIITAIIINMIVIGFWHGANWTYGLFGLYHGLLFIPLVYFGIFSKKKKLKPGILGFATSSDLIKMTVTYILVAIGHTIFRSPDVSTAIDFIFHIFAPTIFNTPMTSLYLYQALIGIGILIIHDNMAVYKPNRLLKNSHYPALKYVYAILIAFLIGAIGIMDSSQFIYFKF